MIVPDQNEKQEYALWDKGKLIGYARMGMFQGKLVLESSLPSMRQMHDDAAKEGVTLILNEAYRPFSRQLEYRKRNRKKFEDKLTKEGKTFESKLDDENFMLTAPSNEFLPATARPGWSNHHDGTAEDWDTVDDNGKIRPAYAWLKNNAIKYENRIRTVASEPWHWELRPGHAQYSVVPEDHPSWATT